MEVNTTDSRWTNLRLYFLIMKLSLRSRMSYRLNFIVMFISVFLKELATLTLLFVVVQQFKVLDGWTKWEIAMLYSMVTFTYRMFCSFLGGVQRIDSLILKGEMDSYLLTPRSPLFLINARNTMIWRVYYNIPILVLLVFCAVKSNVAVTPLHVVMFMVYIVSSTLIMFALFLSISTLSFFVINVTALQMAVADIIRQYLVYPIGIFGKILAFIITFIIPLGFIAYYPSASLIGMTKNVVFSSTLGLFTPLVAAVCCGLAILFWRFGVKRYNSTGT